MLEPSPAAPPSIPPSQGTLVRRVFSYRLTIGLMFVVIGAAFVRPHTLWGEHQILGFVLSALVVAAGMGLRFWAAGSAGTHTHSPEIEGPQLATGGPFARVRNPIYLGSMILGLGMVGLIGDARLLPLYLAAFALLYTIIIPAEERFLATRFGAAYADYRAAVPRMLPRISPWPGARRAVFAWQSARGELRLLGVLACVYGVLEVGAWLRRSM